MRLNDIPYDRLPLDADIHGELRDALYRAWNAVEAKRRAEAASDV